MKVLVIGDSVMWGQGLKEKDKLHVLASRSIAALQGISHEEIDILHLAHSGATIYGSSENSPEDVIDKRIPNWQEVPSSFPTILEQVDFAASHYQARNTQPELILLDGGINDIGAFNIIDPRYTEAKLEKDLKKKMYAGMSDLLNRTRTHFPEPLIMVMGYFPFVSNETSLKIIQVVGGLLSSLAIPLDLLATLQAQRVVHKTRYFHERQLSLLRKVVHRFHADPGTRGKGVLFVDPAFGPQHSVGASDALLFSPKEPDDPIDALRRFFNNPVSNVLALEPDDPVAEDRREACEQVQGAGQKCLIAAVAHPNEKGAARYAEAIQKKFLEYRSISLKRHVKKLLRGSGPKSVHAASRKYYLDMSSLSLSSMMQDMIVDSIDVVIKTKDKPFAGTDHDVFFSVGGLNEWSIGGYIHEGDIRNDFERDSIKMYSINPSEGNLNGKLHLRDLKKLSLRLEFNPAGVGLEPYPTWKPEFITFFVNGIRLYTEEIDQTLRRGDTWTAKDFPSIKLIGVLYKM